MKAYSLDLRTRVVEAIDNGMSRTQAVRVFQVSLGSIKRWLRQRQISGSLAPMPRSGKLPSIGSAQESLLRFQLEQFPDATVWLVVKVPWLWGSTGVDECWLVASCQLKS